MSQELTETWKPRAPGWSAEGGRDRYAKQLVTRGALAVRIRRLLQALALPLEPPRRAPGLGSAPSAARPSGDCSLREAGLRRRPPGHVGGKSRQKSAAPAMCAVLSAHSSPSRSAIKGSELLTSLTDVPSLLFTANLLEKGSLNSLSPLPPSSSARQLLPGKKVPLSPSFTEGSFKSLLLLSRFSRVQFCEAP